MSGENWKDMIAAYVLDALEGDELTTFETRLEADAELRAEVDAARESLARMAEAMPMRTPPPALKNRILEQARQARPAQGESAVPVDPTAVVAATGARASVDASKQSAPRAIESAPGSRRAASPVPWVLLAASLAGLFWMGNRSSDLAFRAETLESQLATVRSSLGEAEATLAGLDSIALLLSGPNVRMATLSGDQAPQVRVIWNPDRAVMLVAVNNLPTPIEGRTYQLWGIPSGGQPVSLGTFETDASGSAFLTLTAAASDYDISAITDEPVGGSAQPTTQPFLVGSWSALQE